MLTDFGELFWSTYLYIIAVCMIRDVTDFEERIAVAG